MELWVIVTAIVIFLLRKMILRTLVGIVVSLLALSGTAWVAWQVISERLEGLPLP